MRAGRRVKFDTRRSVLTRIGAKPVIENANARDGFTQKRFFFCFSYDAFKTCRVFRTILLRGLRKESVSKAGVYPLLINDYRTTARVSIVRTAQTRCITAERRDPHAPKQKRRPYRRGARIPECIPGAAFGIRPKRGPIFVGIYTNSIHTHTYIHKYIYTHTYVYKY